MAALACPAILLWAVLLHPVSAAASAFGGRVLEVTDRDLSSERELLALYHRWLSLYRPHDSAAGGENALPPRRFHVFKENALHIHRANRRANVSYELGLNKFSDLTNEEFRSLYTRSSAKIARRQPERKRGFLHEDSAAILPQSVDWRTKGAVTGVKDQGDCGSCWAFSTVAAVEGINQITGGELVSLSEQELVDCDREVNAGCDGGLMDYAFQFIVDSGGISTARDYPYTATDGGRCNTTKDSRAIVIDGYEDVPTGNMSGLLKAVSQQPVSVAIEASSIAFQFYWRGVFTGGCGTNLDHGVAIVGYGESNWGTEYWIVKNSWGSDWGEEGYIRVERKEGKGLCGINMLGSYPIKITPDPLPQTNKEYPQALLTRKTGLFPSH